MMAGAKGSWIICIATFSVFGLSLADHDTKFTQWTPWTWCNCDPTASRRRERDCKLTNKDLCKGAWRESQRCGNRGCRVDGNWGEWSAYSACSKTCGSGVQRRTRQCDNPAPANNGRSCPNNADQVIPCSLPECPDQTTAAPDPTTAAQDPTTAVPDPTTAAPDPTTAAPITPAPTPVQGHWAQWSQWTGCWCDPSMTRSRQRSCSVREACKGAFRETQRCERMGCPVKVDGNWGEWSAYVCQVTCGPGNQRRTRQCNNPRPANGGRSCPGRSYDVCPCPRLPDCEVPTTAAPTTPAHTKVDGRFGQWSAWSCSVTCGEGRGHRSRECDSPRPQHGGATCVGDTREERRCSKAACRVLGHWGTWSSWSYCNRRTCTTSRRRVCRGGNYCGGVSKQLRRCACAVNGNWGSWGPWSVCDKSCGGTSHRHRQCNNPPPSYYGRRCDGWSNNYIRCNRSNSCKGGSWLNSWG